MRTRRTVVALAVLAAAVAACSTLPTGPARDGDPPLRGFTFAAWLPHTYQEPGAAVSMRDLAATGANTVAVLVTAYQEGPRAFRVFEDDQRTPGEASLRSALAAARANGLATALKPHVDLPGNRWRGEIQPDDPQAWFSSYGDWVVGLARLAEAEGVTLFLIGTELAGTVEHGARWRELIARVRRVFSGSVSYAASWDEANRVGFWDALDYVGVDAYFPVARRTDAGRLEILAGWQPWLARLERLHRQTGRPLLLTEIGYRSVDGAGMAPYEFRESAPVDAGEQADLYWAALEAVGSAPWIHGVYWWNWLADGSGGPENRDYTPQGKEAEDELRGSWR